MRPIGFAFINMNLYKIYIKLYYFNIKFNIQIQLKMYFDSKWVAVARHGLILWENGATDLRILLKYLLGLKNTFFFFFGYII